MIGAGRVIELLGLVPLEPEGGYFRETYRSGLVLAPGSLGSGPAGERSVCTQIYYLLTPETVSTLHVVASDETFHHYLGDPVEQLRLHPDGRGEVVRLGPDLERGERPQTVVPAGVWQGARLDPRSGAGAGFALLGCTVSPGFDYADFSVEGADGLAARFPEHADLIRALLPG